jgi:LysM repeat protein
MLKKLFFILSSFILTITLLWAGMPVVASPQNPQAYYQTPTAGADGRILYTIKQGDTCLSISLTTGVDDNNLRKLNNLDQNCLLIEGKQLLLGIYQTPTVTPGPSPTPTPILPTPTPFNGNGEICVLLYIDINGNGRPESATGEIAIAGGAVLLTDKKTGTPNTQNTPDTVNRVCFKDLPEGDYNISVAPPQGYNPTTSMNYPLHLQAGDISYIDFGAQPSTAAVTPPPSEGGRSPMLGILGGFLVLAGIALAIYFKFLSH